MVFVQMRSLHHGEMFGSSVSPQNSPHADSTFDRQPEFADSCTSSICLSALNVLRTRFLSEHRIELPE